MIETESIPSWMASLEDVMKFHQHFSVLKAIEEPDLETKHHLDGAWTSLICPKTTGLQALPLFYRVDPSAVRVGFFISSSLNRGRNLPISASNLLAIVVCVISKSTWHSSKMMEDLKLIPNLQPQDVEKLIEEVQKARRIKLLHQPSKVLLFWLSIVKVTRIDDELEFCVRIASADFAVSNFDESPTCGCGFDCVNVKGRKIKPKNRCALLK